MGKDIAKTSTIRLRKKASSLFVWEAAGAINGHLLAGTRETFRFAMGRPECRALEFVTPDREFQTPMQV